MTRLSPGRRLYRFLISMKLALTLLFVIAIISILGTILPQGDQVYETDWVYNPLFDFYNTIGLFDMYWSWWFQALLVLLALNLAVCVADRLPVALKRAFRPRLDVRDAFVANQPCAATINGTGQRGIETAARVLSGKRYRLRTGSSGAVLAQKGRLSGLASLAFHASFLFLAVGAIWGHTLGFDETVEVPDGKTANVPYSDFQVKNHGFKIQYVEIAENGRVTGYRPSEYSSDLEIFRGGKPVERKTITVNDPLRLEGINFYQGGYYPTSRGYVTVLQVNHYPGKSLVYVGFGLMMAGVCYSLYIPHRRIWLKRGESDELLVGGRTSRSKVSFSREFDGLVSEIRLQLGQEARADG